MKATLFFRKGLAGRASSNVWHPLPIILSVMNPQMKMVLIGLLLSNILFSVSYSQHALVLYQAPFPFANIADPVPGMNQPQINDEKPYARFSDTFGGSFIGRKFLPGEHTLTATPFSFSEKGIAHTVFFTVKGSFPVQPVTVWDRSVGGEANDDLGRAIATPDGGYLLTGISLSNISGEKSENIRGGFDYWIVKLDGRRNRQWDKTFGGQGSEEGLSVVLSPGGGYLLAGSSNSDMSGEKSENSRGLFDYWVVKIDDKGNKVWDKTFGGRLHDFLVSAISIEGGGYLLAGYSSSDISGDKSEDTLGDKDFWIIKIDEHGNKIWEKTLGGNGSEEPGGLTPAEDGGCLVAGYSNSDISGDKSENSKGTSDYWVVRIDSHGNKLWDKTIGGSNSESATAVVAASGGGFFVGGSSASDASGDKSENSKGSWDYWVVKIDVAGNKVWDKTLGGDEADYLTSAILTPDGHFLVGGSTTSNASGDKSENGNGADDYWLAKIKADGNKAWDKTLGGSDGDYLTSISLTSDGSYLVGGSSTSDASGDRTENNRGCDVLWGYCFSDYWIVKLREPGDHVVTSLTLMNAYTDQEIQELKDGDVINLAAGTRLLDIRANIAAENINKVAFDLKGPVAHRQTEINPPYALFSNHENDFKGRELLPGAYTLTVTPDITDIYDAALTISFTVTDGPVVTSLTLMNAHTDQEIKELEDGDIISLAEVGTKLLDIRANIAAENINKVVFDLKGPVSHRQTELNPPYALFSNHDSDFKGRKLLPGAYTLTVMPYIHDTKGAVLTIAFVVTEGSVVTSLTLMNAHADQEIKELNDGDVISLVAVGTKLLDIRANTTAENVSKVAFDLKGPVSHRQTELNPPYALFSNHESDFKGRDFLPGAYSLIVTPYVNNTKGTALAISFVVISDSAPAASQQVEVYPVPASEMVNILHEGGTGDAHITLLDFHGSVLLQQPLSQYPVEQLDVSSFRKGIHYLKVVSPEGVQIIRIVIE